MMASPPIEVVSSCILPPDQARNQRAKAEEDRRDETEKVICKRAPDDETPRVTSRARMVHFSFDQASQTLPFEPRQNVASRHHTEDLAVGCYWYVANAVLGHFSDDVSHRGVRLDCHEIQ
jgi:hypothetical protein